MALQPYRKIHNNFVCGVNFSFKINGSFSKGYVLGDIKTYLVYDKQHISAYCKLRKHKQSFFLISNLSINYIKIQKRNFITLRF